MSTLDEQYTKNWWAEGDTKVHQHSRVTYFIDGRMTMLSMCLHFIKAQKYIYLANWGMTPGLELVRGTDHRAGPDGSPEQEQLLAKPRANGLTEADIAFWCSHDLSVQAVLGYAVSKGIEVKVLLWDCLEIPEFALYNPTESRDQLTQVGVTCLLDDSARGIMHHPVESLHQKVSVVDGTHGFVGGIDPMVEARGDYDRWDTQAHPFDTPLRHMQDDDTPHPWHDAHSHIEGPAVGDVELNIRQRWNSVVERHNLGNDMLIPERPAPAPVESNDLVQLARTIPQHTYKFDSDQGVQGIAQLYAHAFSNAQHLIYLENQYFWLHNYSGVDVPLLGRNSPDMENNIRLVGEALNRGAMLAIVLPDHPNVGRAFTDEGITRLREEAPQAAQEGRIQAFVLAVSSTEDDGEHYRPIYVHAKVGIVDDIWSTVGSGNLNNRGMRDDTEMNVATLDPKSTLSLRLRLWAEHLGLLSEQELWDLARHVSYHHESPEENERGAQLWRKLHDAIGDAGIGLRMMTERAADNLNRYKAKQPLIGNLLPYLTADEATQQGIEFHGEHGWIEEPAQEEHEQPIDRKALKG